MQKFDKNFFIEQGRLGGLKSAKKNSKRLKALWKTQKDSLNKPKEIIVKSLDRV